MTNDALHAWTCKYSYVETIAGICNGKSESTKIGQICGFVVFLPAEFCVLQLRSHLTEVLLDQMPVLSELQRYLEQLAIMDPPAIKSELIIEQVRILIFVFKRSSNVAESKRCVFMLLRVCTRSAFCRFALIEFPFICS